MTRRAHNSTIEHHGDGMTWIATCSCGTFRAPYRTEGAAMAAHAHHVRFVQPVVKR